MDQSTYIKNIKKIGIFGNGVTGSAVARLCEKHDIEYKIFDAYGECHTSFFDDDAKQYDIIVRSPSFTMTHPWVSCAISNGCTCLTELDFAYCFWTGKIVAITGTNGKTTTTEFLTFALQKYGIDARKAGNIGIAFSDVVASEHTKDTWAIVEVSSFQMDGTTLFSPDFVLWTNFDNDHLDVHSTPKEYFLCKSQLLHLVRRPNQYSSTCFVGPSVDAFAHRFELDNIRQSYTICTDHSGLPESSPLNIKTQRENFALVNAFWKTCKFEQSVLEQATLEFSIPPHRLQKISTIYSNNIDANITKSVTFWDDSKATNFHALNGALKSFDEPIILIAGGKSKEEPIPEFLNIIRNKVKALLIMGSSGKQLYDAVKADDQLSKNISCMLFHYNNDIQTVMNNIVREAYWMAKDGDNIVLSPGYSSLDWFKDYSERGRFFQNSVLSLNLNNKC